MFSGLGILRVKTMVDKIMYIPNDDTQNYLFSRLQFLDTQLHEPTIQNFSLPEAAGEHQPPLSAEKFVHRANPSSLFSSEATL